MARASNLPVTVAIGVRKSFTSAFQSISDQAHVVIVAEGAPLHSDLNAEQMMVLGTALPYSEVPAAKAIAAIADAFDYDVEERPRQIFLLRKRYSDPMDLPCVTYDEVVHSLRSVTKLTGAYSPKTHPVAGGTGPTDSPLTLFASSLTPEQLQKANTGLAVSELSPEQQILAVHAAQFAKLNAKTQRIEIALDHLDALKDAHTVFCWMHLLDGPAFGYQGLLGIAGELAQFPLSNGYLSQPGSMYRHDALQVGESGAPGTDPTLPTDEDKRLAAGMMASHLPCMVTLRALADDLIHHDSSKPAIQVDDAVAEKPVSLFGKSYTTTDHIVRSCSELYALRLLVPREKVYRIGLPIPRATESMGDIPAEMRRLIPLPIARALERQITLYSDSRPHSLPPSKMSARSKEAFMIAQQQRLASEVSVKAVNAFYYPAIRRVLVLAEPEVPKPSSPPVPVISANPEVLRLLAIAMMSSDCAMGIENLVNLQVPSFLNRPDAMYVQVGYVPGRYVFTGFGTGGHDAKGRIISNVFYGVGTPKPKR